MHDDRLEHLHSHLERIQRRLDGMDAHLQQLARLEIVTSLQEMRIMAKASEEISKLTGKMDAMSAVVTDVHSDFEALRAVLTAERDNLTEAGQAAVDAANAKADALRDRLSELDVAVGDADGSDIPSDVPPAGEPTDGTGTPGGDATVPASPVDEAPPAGEGTVVNPDVPADGGDQDFRPTA